MVDPYNFGHPSPTNQMRVAKYRLEKAVGQQRIELPAKRKLLLAEESAGNLWLIAQVPAEIVSYFPCSIVIVALGETVANAKLYLGKYTTHRGEYFVFEMGG